MTSRSVQILKKAVALQKIEANLPEKFVTSLPNTPEERTVAILEYLAAVLEKRSAKASEPPKEA